MASRIDRRSFFATVFTAILGPRFAKWFKPKSLFNSKYLGWFNGAKYQFGFTGFKAAQKEIETVGQYLYCSNIIVPNPRQNFKLINIGKVEDDQPSCLPNRSIV